MFKLLIMLYIFSS